MSSTASHGMTAPLFSCKVAWKECHLLKKKAGHLLMYQILRLHTGFWMRTDTCFSVTNGTDSYKGNALNSWFFLKGNSPWGFSGFPSHWKGHTQSSRLAGRLNQVGDEIRDIDDFILLFTLLVFTSSNPGVKSMSMWHLKENKKVLKACDLTLLNFWMPIHRAAPEFQVPQEGFHPPSPQRQDDTEPHLR